LRRRTGVASTWVGGGSERRDVRADQLCSRRCGRSLRDSFRLASPPHALFTTSQLLQREPGLDLVLDVEVEARLAVLGTARRRVRLLRLRLLGRFGGFLALIRQQSCQLRWGDESHSIQWDVRGAPSCRTRRSPALVATGGSPAVPARLHGQFRPVPGTRRAGGLSLSKGTVSSTFTTTRNTLESCRALRDHGSFVDGCPAACTASGRITPLAGPSAPGLLAWLPDRPARALPAGTARDSRCWARPRADLAVACGCLRGPCPRAVYG
jgi:hypothetical protein